MYTRGVRLRLALALVIVLPSAHAQRPTKSLPPLNPFNPAPPLERPIWIRIVPSVPAPVSRQNDGPSFDEVPLHEKLTLAAQATGPQSDESRAALESARELWQRILNLDLPAPSETGTLTRAGEDVAVGQGWLATNARGFSRYLMWDDPIATSLLIEVPGPTLTNPAVLEKLMTGLVAWGQGHLYSIEIAMSPGPPGKGHVFRGWASLDIVQQMNLGPALTASGAYDGAQAWLTINCMINNSGIAERFPPLRDRVHDWTTKQLLSALGHGGRAEHAPWKSYERDRVLISEALKRADFAPSDLRALIQAEAGTGADVWRLPWVIEHAARTDNGAQFSPVFMEYFRSPTSGHPPGSGSSNAVTLMRTINELGSPGFCALSIGLLPQHVAIGESLQYLTKFCSGQEAYDAVQSLEDRPEYSQQRSDALAQLAKRLSNR